MSENSLSQYLLASFTLPLSILWFELLFSLNTYPISIPNDRLRENLKTTAGTRHLPVYHQQKLYYDCIIRTNCDQLLNNPNCNYNIYITIIAGTISIDRRSSYQHHYPWGQLWHYCWSAFSINIFLKRTVHTDWIQTWWRNIHL